MKARGPSAAFFAVALALAPPPARGQGYGPDEAAGKMTVADGFAVKLVAAEPVVRQPVAIEFDERGRLWVVQYLQYPNPAGLKRVRVDRYSRTAYDRVPEPPPKGPKGADVITILSDFDEDGRARKSKDFLSGLNLASGIAFGHGGVYVLQTPYLLFYPDRDRDDVPDGDPDVLLRGFGMEDAHAVANSLTWGSDGWPFFLFHRLVERRTTTPTVSRPPTMAGVSSSGGVGLANFTRAAAFPLASRQARRPLPFRRRGICVDRGRGPDDDGARGRGRGRWPAARRGANSCTNSPAESGHLFVQGTPG
jgi:hypothetical protein